MHYKQYHLITYLRKVLRVKTFYTSRTPIRYNMKMSINETKYKQLVFGKQSTKAFIEKGYAKSLQGDAV